MSCLARHACTDMKLPSHNQQPPPASRAHGADTRLAHGECVCVCVCVCRSLGSHSRICQILTVGELYICKLTYSILYLKPQDQALSHFCDHLSHMQSTEMFKCPPTHIPSEGHIRPCSACLLQLCYCKQVSFLWSSSCCIFVLSVGDFAV